MTSFRKAITRFAATSIAALPLDFTGARTALVAPTEDVVSRFLRYAQIDTQSRVAPKLTAVRGGTDGAELAVLGLPTPNIFSGGNNFHGFLEFNSRRGMEKTVETLVNLVSTYAGSAVAN